MLYRNQTAKTLHFFAEHRSLQGKVPISCPRSLKLAKMRLNEKRNWWACQTWFRDLMVFMVFIGRSFAAMAETLNHLELQATSSIYYKIVFIYFDIFIATLLFLPAVCFPQEQIFHSLKTVNDFVFFHCFPQQCLHLFKLTGIWPYLDTSIVYIRHYWRPAMWCSVDKPRRDLVTNKYTK